MGCFTERRAARIRRNEQEIFSAHVGGKWYFKRRRRGHACLKRLELPAGERYLRGAVAVSINKL